MLNTQIRKVIHQFREALPAELSAKIEQGAGEISALDIVERALKSGQKLPRFELANQDGERRVLHEYLDKEKLVLTFYRGVWCPYCNLQLKEYSEHLSEIQNAGATLVAVSPETPDALEVLKADDVPESVTDMAVTDVPFDVLHDEGGRLAEAFGLQFELPMSHRELLQAMNIDLEKLTGNNQFTFPDPATYVIDTTGIITWAFIPNNYRKRAEVDDILRAIESNP